MGNQPTRLDVYRSAVEDAIEQHLPPAGTPPTLLHEAMRYCLGAGGKRLRPVLLLATADLYPRKADPLPAAVALECLHTYTLVHDDLPCMDNSPLRRGKPAAHVRFGEATAVLAGDALLTEAFRLLASAYADIPDLAAQLTRLLAEAADSRHLIAGQVVDTFSENEAISAETLDYIHAHKTADLLGATLVMGHTLSEAPSGNAEALREAGHQLGLAFQIIDDILDATSSTEALGKEAGSDARMAKNTYVSLHGLEAAREAAGKATERARAKVRSLPDTDPSFLHDLIGQLEHRLR
ncbi:MAG: polyprenyl synthetase family protein [Verrucomicrobia bacterium]|jgi:geranylgeranyl pyrophosphate synthase|nr:polyprenyl synthetase family protein [Verrucomicrobiota bacterium]